MKILVVYFTTFSLSPYKYPTKWTATYQFFVCNSAVSRMTRTWILVTIVALIFKTHYKIRGDFILY
jgi:hypothetical protein